MNLGNEFNNDLNRVLGSYQSLKKFDMDNSHYDEFKGKYVEGKLDSKRAVLLGNWRAQRDKGLTPIAENAKRVAKEIEKNVNNLDLQSAMELATKLKNVKKEINDLKENKTLENKFEESKGRLTYSKEFTRFVKKDLLKEPKKKIEATLQAVNNHIEKLLKTEVPSNQATDPEKFKPHSPVPERKKSSQSIRLGEQRKSNKFESESKEVIEHKNEEPEIFDGDRRKDFRKISKYLYLDESSGNNNNNIEEDLEINYSKNFLHDDFSTSFIELPTDFLEEEKVSSDNLPPDSSLSDIIIEDENEEKISSPRNSLSSDNIVMVEVKNEPEEIIEGENKVKSGESVEVQEKKFEFNPETYQIPFFHTPSDELDKKELFMATLQRTTIFNDARSKEGNKLIGRMEEAYSSYQEHLSEVTKINERLKDLREPSPSVNPSVSMEELPSLPVPPAPPPPALGPPPPPPPPPPGAKNEPPPMPLWKLKAIKDAAMTVKIVEKDDILELEIELNEAEKKLAASKNELITLLFGDPDPKKNKEVQDPVEKFDSLTEKGLVLLKNRYIEEAENCAKMDKKAWVAQTEKAIADDNIKSNQKKAPVILNEEEKAFSQFITTKRTKLNSEYNTFTEFSNRLNDNIKDYNTLAEKAKKEGLKSLSEAELKKFNYLRTYNVAGEKEKKDELSKQLIVQANEFQSYFPNPQKIQEKASIEDKAVFVQTTLAKADTLIENIKTNKAQNLAAQYAKTLEKKAAPKVIRPKVAGEETKSEAVKKTPLKKVINKEEETAEKVEASRTKNAMLDELKMKRKRIDG